MLVIHIKDSYVWVYIFQRKSSGWSVFNKEIVPAHDLEGSDFFRGDPNFARVTNFGRSIFTVTVLATSLLQFLF